MNLMVVVNVSPDLPAKKVILVDYSSGRGKEDAISEVLRKINTKIPEDATVVDFEVKTYTTPVTRRTYAVGIVVYNIPMGKKPLREFTVQERRQLLAGVLKAFEYNPKILNISELARVFGVSRDSIYYDIEQILKERRRG
ncbi:hypothetical protein [Thermococcus sp.]|uniref:hypothetical protein n=1 Tax=Thermococcus sp. TaxID=35749 RepID=UPI0026089EB9|nr:hypothetical protein [Thermococcus sp.]